MADETDVLLKFCEEQWMQARQSENQRSTMANFVISIFTAGIGLIVLADFALKALPVAVFLVLLGAFGGLFSMKLFERWRLHEQRAIQWSQRIDELNPDARLLELFWVPQTEHKANHPKLRKIALYRLWGLLYVILTGVAIVLSLLIVLLHNLP